MAGLYIMGLYILGFLNKDEKDGNYVILMEDLPSVNSNFLELLIRECDPWVNLISEEHVCVFEQTLLGQEGGKIV